MGKYGIGARVRDDDGDEGVITDKRKSERLVDFGIFELWTPKSQLTVIEDAPAFEVGDRVRFTDKCPKGWWFGAHTDHKEGVILPNDGTVGYRYRVSIIGAADYGFVDAEHIEKIVDSASDPASAPSVTLRAGSYYELRNGEVIGPLVANDDEGFVWTTEPRKQAGDSWTTESRWLADCIDHERDIVAEAVGAEDPKPALKFKVDDRVRSTALANLGEMGTIANGGLEDAFPNLYLVSFDTWRQGHDDCGSLPDDRGWYLTEDELEAVEPDAATVTLTARLIGIDSSGENIVQFKSGGATYSVKLPFNPLEAA